jgi:hypothetical protein
MCRCGVRHGHNCASGGGLPVVFFGDDVQLPSVLDSPVYNSSGKCPHISASNYATESFVTRMLAKL